ncbi:MAG: response regulator [Phycisphaeraceae bacterium]|jgi:DNA-binding response OmpR family regulator|nr:response regulator [Phycisphaeraceae bacterium]
MARRKGTDQPPAPPAVKPDLPAIPRVLIVSGNRLERLRLASKLSDVVDHTGSHIAVCVMADSCKEALKAVDNDQIDLALIKTELPDGSGLALTREIARRGRCPASILLSENPTLDQAVEAMRCGAVDIVSCRAAATDLITSVRTAFERSRQARTREARIDRLTRVCRRLNQARHEVTKQVSSLCGDLVEAYQELSGQVLELSIASEFNSLIRQELDVESLLRTALEFILAKTGPTNAAVFLPATSNDFSLGAYVNYDCPKDAADVLLDHLAGIVAPRMENERELKIMPTYAELEAFLGADAHWLAESSAISFACHHEDECLAVVILFRDRRNPFPETAAPTLSVIADLFGKQLGRVIHIHHRHLPKDQWGGFGEADDDDIDLAA